MPIFGRRYEYVKGRGQAGRDRLGGGRDVEAGGRRRVEGGR
jgi:hypothetical protein